MGDDAEAVEVVGGVAGGVTVAVDDLGEGAVGLVVEPGDSALGVAGLVGEVALVEELSRDLRGLEPRELSELGHAHALAMSPISLTPLDVSATGSRISNQPSKVCLPDVKLEEVSLGVHVERCNNRYTVCIRKFQLSDPPAQSSPLLRPRPPKPDAAHSSIVHVSDEQTLAHSHSCFVPARNREQLTKQSHLLGRERPWYCRATGR